MKIFNLKRKKRVIEESAPQLTFMERRFLETPGPASGGLSYAVYDAMVGDAMIQTCLTVKRLGTLAAPWRIQPFDESAESTRRVEFVQRALDRLDGSPISPIAQAMDAFAKGWSVQEVVWESDGGHYWIRAIKPKDPSMFGLKVDAFGNVQSLELAIPGEPPRTLPRAKFVLFANRSTYGSPKGRSDLDAAHAHWMSKNRLLAAWRHHLERFASPTVLGRFKRGIPPAEQASFLASLRDLHRNTAIVYPDEIEVDTLGGAKEGATAFLDAIDFHNREIARSILGQTLTTDEGRRVGSLALGKVHLQVLGLQLDAIRTELADVVMTEQIIRPLIELNFGSGWMPKFVFETSRSDVFAQARL